MSDLSITELSDHIRAAINELKFQPGLEQVGIVTRIGDGIAWIYGLSACGFSEMISIDAENGMTLTAFAFNLSQDEIGAVILGDDTYIKAGAKAHLQGKVLEVPVGPELIGRESIRLVSPWTTDRQLLLPKPAALNAGLPVYWIELA